MLLGGCNLVHQVAVISSFLTHALQRTTTALHKIRCMSGVLARLRQPRPKSTYFLFDIQKTHVLSMPTTIRMSLYYDAATVLTNGSQDGSFKSRIYGNKLNLKSKPAHIYALISETAKFNHFVKEVIDHADLLSAEPKVRIHSGEHLCVTTD